MCGGKTLHNVKNMWEEKTSLSQKNGRSYKPRCSGNTTTIEMAVN